MIVLLVAAAAATVAGAVVALSTRDARTALGGLGLLILASPFVSDPLPGLVPLAGRIVAGILAIELLWVAAREAAEPVGGSAALDWRVEALAGAAGSIAGAFVGLRYLDAGIQLAPLAPVVLAAAFGLVAVGATPLLISRDTLRLGTGAIVVLIGATLVRVATGGIATPLESLIASGLVVALAAAVAAVTLNALTAAGALGFDDTLPVETELDLELEPEPRSSPRRSTDAAPLVRARSAPRRSGPSR